MLEVQIDLMKKVDPGRLDYLFQELEKAKGGVFVE